MKRIKHILAVITATVLVLAMALPALAAAETGTLTITKTKKDEKYTLYRVLNATHDGGSNYHYTINSEFQTFFDGITAARPADSATATNESVYNYISGLNEEGKRTLAKNLAEYVANNSSTVHSAAGPLTATGDTITQNDLPFGYYLLVPDAASTTGSVIFSLSTLGSTAEIENKTTYPTIEKRVKGPSDANFGKTTIAGKGDLMDFELVSEVPNMYGYTAYTFKFKDTLTNMTFKDGSEVLTIGSKTLVKDTDYTITVTGGKSIEVDIKNFISYVPKSRIILTYKATLDETAVIGGNGNDNKALIEYSNNPTTGETKETKPDKTTTFSLKLKLNKTKEDSTTALTGSKWSLYKYITNALGEREEILVRTIDGAGDPGLSEFEWDLLGEGRYHLYEDAAPAGYQPIHNHIVVTISADGTINTENESSLESLSIVSEAHSHVVEGGTTTDKATGQVGIKVKNTTQSLLPSTGGAGLYVVAAVALLALLGFGGTAFLKKKVNGEE